MASRLTNSWLLRCSLGAVGTAGSISVESPAAWSRESSTRLFPSSRYIGSGKGMAARGKVGLRMPAMTPW